MKTELRRCASCYREFEWAPPGPQGGRPRRNCWACSPAPQAPDERPPRWADLVFALEVWGPESSDHYPWSDEELRQLYWSLARKAPPHGEPRWGKTTYAYWRFERGLGIDEAFWAAEDARDERDRRELAGELRAEGLSEAEQREALARFDAEVERKRREAEEADEE